MLNLPGAVAPDVAPLVRKPLGPLVIGAIGIVFGDIGTSPLYTLRACFTGPHGLPLTPDNVLGILSVVFWAIMIVVTLKYVTLIMRADNRGEGGVMALTALASRGLEKSSMRWWVVGLGIFGAAMFYGDGMITPAISVLSAVEGLEITAPVLTPFVVPLTLVILIARPGVGAASDGRSRHVRHGHRVAGGHLGRFFPDAAGDTDGILPTADHHAHVRARDRPDLRTVHQLDAAVRGDAAGRRLSELQ